MNAIDAPYKIVVHHLRNAPSEVVEAVDDAKSALAKGRADFQARKGHDIVVDFEIFE